MILQDLQEADTKPSDFPHARSFHWKKLRRLIETNHPRRGLKLTAPKKPAPKKPVPKKADVTNYIGLRIKNENAVVSLILLFFCWQLHISVHAQSNRLHRCNTGWVGGKNRLCAVSNWPKRRCDQRRPHRFRRSQCAVGRRQSYEPQAGKAVLDDNKCPTHKRALIFLLRYHNLSLLPSRNVSNCTALQTPFSTSRPTAADRRLSPSLHHVLSTRRQTPGSYAAW